MFNIRSTIFYLIILSLLFAGDLYGGDSLHKAIFDRDLSKVEKLLKEGADPWQKDVVGESAIAEAVRWKRRDIAQVLAESIFATERYEHQKKIGLSVMGLSLVLMLFSIFLLRVKPAIRAWFIALAITGGAFGGAFYRVESFWVVSAPSWLATLLWTLFPALLMSYLALQEEEDKKWARAILPSIFWVFLLLMVRRSIEGGYDFIVASELALPAILSWGLPVALVLFVIGHTLSLLDGNKLLVFPTRTALVNILTSIGAFLSIGLAAIIVSFVSSNYYEILKAPKSASYVWHWSSNLDLNMTIVWNGAVLAGLLVAILVQLGKSEDDEDSRVDDLFIKTLLGLMVTPTAVLLVAALLGALAGLFVAAGSVGFHLAAMVKMFTLAAIFLQPVLLVLAIYLVVKSPNDYDDNYEPDVIEEHIVYRYKPTVKAFDSGYLWIAVVTACGLFGGGIIVFAEGNPLAALVGLFAGGSILFYTLREVILWVAHRFINQQVILKEDVFVYPAGVLSRETFSVPYGELKLSRIDISPKDARGNSVECDEPYIYKIDHPKGEFYLEANWLPGTGTVVEKLWQQLQMRSR